MICFQHWAWYMIHDSRMSHYNQYCWFILVSHRTSIAPSVMKFPQISKEVYIYMHIDLLTSCFFVRMSLEAHTICWSKSHSDSCEDFTQGDALMALMWLIEGAGKDAVILDLEEVGEREGTDDSVVIWAWWHPSEASTAKKTFLAIALSHINIGYNFNKHSPIMAFNKRVLKSTLSYACPTCFVLFELEIFAAYVGGTRGRGEQEIPHFTAIFSISLLLKVRQCVCDPIKYSLCCVTYLMTPIHTTRNQCQEEEINC